MSITKKALLATLALPLVTFLQEPPPQEPETPQAPDLDIFGRPQKGVANSTLALMQGAWQLMSLKADADYPPTGLEVGGFMLISGPFMAMTVQLSWDHQADIGLDFAEDFQSFIAEIVPQAAGEIECKTLIGASMATEEDALDWEEVGATRRFKIFVDGSMMTLSWGNGNRMTFGRRRAALSEKQGFFGVPDAFGGGGSRDLFGRGRPGEKKEDDR